MPTKEVKTEQRTVEQVLNGSGTLDMPALESMLWDAASSIRGPVEAPKYKNYILPLIFVKRLSDVFEDELADLGGELGEKVDQLVADDHALVRVEGHELPPEYKGGNHDLSLAPPTDDGVG